MVNEWTKFNILYVSWFALVKLVRPTRPIYTVPESKGGNARLTYDQIDKNLSSLG